MLLLAAAIAFSSLPSGAIGILERAGVGEAAFPGFVTQINADAARREVDGEREHLVFFVLQSEAFTKLPKIEPAVSAREWKKAGAVPVDVGKRAEAFLSGRVTGERMRYLRSILPAMGGREFVLAEYRRTMGVLYAKEFERSGDFYQTRGHSTDTNVAANYAVWSGLRVWKAMHPKARLDRVLIVGPGLDFAPRTGMDETHEPQSYQPYAVADALLELGLSIAPKITCWDISPRVIRFFEEFPARKQATLFLATMAGDPEYLSYFDGLGKAIGRVESQGLEKTIAIRPEILGSVTAARGNIVTEVPTGGFDLVIATNVLVYCKDLELLLAMANISAGLKDGGIFLLNEIRPAVDNYASATGLTAVQARTLKIAQGVNAPLYDAFAIYRKTPKHE